MMRGLYRRAMLPFGPLHAVPTPENRRYLAARRRLHAMIDALLTSRSTEDIEDTEDTAVDVLRAGRLRMTARPR
ncbi:MAG: hypothetical protein ACJ73U_09520 [Actinophytocola sp.]